MPPLDKLSSSRTDILVRPNDSDPQSDTRSSEVVSSIWGSPATHICGGATRRRGTTRFNSVPRTVRQPGKEYKSSQQPFRVTPHKDLKTRSFKRPYAYTATRRKPSTIALQPPNKAGHSYQPQVRFRGLTTGPLSQGDRAAAATQKPKGKDLMKFPSLNSIKSTALTCNFELT